MAKGAKNGKTPKENEEVIETDIEEGEEVETDIEEGEEVETDIEEGEEGQETAQTGKKKPAQIMPPKPKKPKSKTPKGSDSSLDLDSIAESVGKLSEKVDKLLDPEKPGKKEETPGFLDFMKDLV